MENHLPPLVEKYEGQLESAQIEVSTPANYELYVAALELFDVPPQRQGVPAMFIGDTHLVGTDEIARQLEGLIQKHLKQGGVDYPPIPGLEGALPSATPAAVALALENKSPALHISPGESDGYALAIVIMVGMVAALIYTGVAVAQGVRGIRPRPAPAWQTLAIPFLALVGLGVAGYLAYVEARAVPAVCGPVGDCNAVQSSSYARLGGVLPVGVLGAVGYAAILTAWLWGRFRLDRLAEYAPLALFGMTLFGALFSLHLTYLEPFVIHAVCAWCLTSAVIVTLLMLLSVNPLLRTMNAGTQLRSEGS